MGNYYASYRPEEPNRMNADNTMKTTAKPSKHDWSPPAAGLNSSPSPSRGLLGPREL
jgi:hypothetical protein